MAIGSLPKSSAQSFPIAKGGYKDNVAETSTKPADAGNKKDPKQGTQSFGPSGLVMYGTGKAKNESLVYGVQYQDTTTTFAGPGGTGAYAGQTRALEARARWNEVADTSFDGDGKLELGIDGQAQANLFRSEHGVDYQSPAVRYAGRDVLSAEAHANGGVLVGAQVDGSVNLNLSLSTAAGFKGRVGAFAGAAVRAEGEVRGTALGVSAGVHARGEAWAGAQAWAEATVGIKGVHASAGAFAGAAAGGSVGADVMGVGVEATGEVWAGAGAKASFDATFKDGKITIGAEAGAALGVGAAGAINVTIDTNRIAHDATAAWDTVTGIAGQAADDAGRLAGSAFNAASRLLDGAVQTGRDVATTVGDAATEAAEQAARDAAKAAEDAAKAAADAAAAAAKTAADAAEGAVDAVADAASDAWNWLTGNG